MEWWMWMTVAAFLGGILYTIFTVFKATGKNDHKADMTQAITNVTVVNLVLILVLAGTGYFYTGQYPTAREPYIMFMLHLSLLLSIVSVSVASLFSVSN
jgi:uncharacterized membrane protein YozB (DUF420 family)